MNARALTSSSIFRSKFCEQKRGGGRGGGGWGGGSLSLLFTYSPKFGMRSMANGTAEATPVTTNIPRCEKSRTNTNITAAPEKRKMTEWLMIQTILE